MTTVILVKPDAQATDKHHKLGHTHTHFIHTPKDKEITSKTNNVGNTRRGCFIGG